MKPDIKKSHYVHDLINFLTKKLFEFAKAWDSPSLNKDKPQDVLWQQTTALKQV